jgi:hypothetical protein
MAFVIPTLEGPLDLSLDEEEVICYERTQGHLGVVLTLIKVSNIPNSRDHSGTEDREMVNWDLSTRLQGGCCRTNSRACSNDCRSENRVVPTSNHAQTTC